MTNIYSGGPYSSSDDGVVWALYLGCAQLNELNIQNTGTTAAFFSMDGGFTWAYLAANSTTTLQHYFARQVALNNASSVGLQRTPGGSDFNGVFIWGY